MVVVVLEVGLAMRLREQMKYTCKHSFNNFQMKWYYMCGKVSLCKDNTQSLDPLFLKLSASIVATPITSLFNLSFISSEIPKDWKAAVFIPLFKGERHPGPKLLQTYIHPALPI